MLYSEADIDMRKLIINTLKTMIKKKIFVSQLLGRK